jgi:hypothetical protein
MEAAVFDEVSGGIVSGLGGEERDRRKTRGGKVNC